MSVTIAVKEAVVVFVIIAVVVVDGRDASSSGTSSRTTTSTTTTRTLTTNEAEARNLKLKLTTAEEQVRGLLRKMDSVNEDAARAKAEIHDTLREAWHLVDLLAQSSEAIETFRVKLTIAEEKTSSLEGQLKDRDTVIGNLRTEVATTKEQLVGVTKERDEQAAVSCKPIEDELLRTQDKLQWSMSLFNESMIYGRLSGSYEVMRQVMIQKYELLDKVQSLLSDWRVGYEKIDSQISSMDTVLRDADREHQLMVSSLRLDTDQVAAVQQRVYRLEKQLKEAVRDRDAAIAHAESVQSSLNALTGTAGQGASGPWAVPATSSSYLREPAPFPVFLLLLFFTLFLGAGIIMWSGALRGPSARAVPHEPATTTPSRFMPGSGPTTPGGNGFHHSNRSPMQYYTGASPSPSPPRQ